MGLAAHVDVHMLHKSPPLPPSPPLFPCCTYQDGVDGPPRHDLSTLPLHPALCPHCTYQDGVDGPPRHDPAHPGNVQPAARQRPSRVHAAQRRGGQGEGTHVNIPGGECGARAVPEQPLRAFQLRHLNGSRGNGSCAIVGAADAGATAPSHVMQVWALPRSGGNLSCGWAPSIRAPMAGPAIKGRWQ